jgi:LacI family transcriptional regulator, galactose operon repressor
MNKQFKEKKNITISDIAYEAGVSKTTVSRVISNSPKVRDEVRNRILNIMKKHSYVPNLMAQGLAGSPTRIIGIIIEELSNFFFIEIAEGFDQIISAANYSMQISSSKWAEKKELSLIQNLIRSKVDGILLAPVSFSISCAEVLKNSGIPFVLINYIPDDKQISYVSCDNYEGGKLAARYVNKLDRKQTILITGFKHQTLSDRIKGFKDNLSNTNNFFHYENINTFEHGYDLVPILQTRNSLKNIKTTLFITNDNVATGIIERLIERGISIPEQVAVIGYDNIKLSSLCKVPLTTISQSITNMGKIAAMELLEMIKNPNKERAAHLIKPEIVIRESAVLDFKA